ncbi:MAG: hypothetical protein Q8O68_01300 [Candidatus Daviesbacteria bacterium]|nr:hypothetical protein [Candidatus Daviesbacteria bacterium]
MQDTETEAQLSLEELIQSLDKAVEGKPGIKPSDAWRYREEVRTKYGLPECGYSFEDPLRYIQAIEAFLKENRVEIRNKHDFSTFFKENPKAEAVSSGPGVFRNSTVVVGAASDTDWFGLRTRAKQLSHESVHALQDKRYPEMPIDVAEKEAFYYQMLTPQTFLRYKDDPAFLMHFINGVVETSIKSSVEIDKKISNLPN